MCVCVCLYSGSIITTIDTTHIYTMTDYNGPHALVTQFARPFLAELHRNVLGGCPYSVHTHGGTCSPSCDIPLRCTTSIPRGGLMMGAYAWVPPSYPQVVGYVVLAGTHRSPDIVPHPSWTRISSLSMPSFP